MPPALRRTIWVLAVALSLSMSFLFSKVPWLRQAMALPSCTIGEVISEYPYAKNCACDGFVGLNGAGHEVCMGWCLEGKVQDPVTKACRDPEMLTLEERLSRLEQTVEHLKDVLRHTQSQYRIP